MKIKGMLLGMIVFSIFSYAQLGIKKSTPKKTLHVNGSMQLVNELSLGGSSDTEGFAGVAGQVLKSNGPGAAPTWENVAGVPNSTGTVIAVGGEFIIAQEIVLQLTADYIRRGGPNSSAIGNLTNKIIDNENKYSGNNTGNSFTVSADGIYEVIINAQLSTTNRTNPVIGIWNNSTNQWVVRVNDRFVPSTGDLQTYTLLTSIPMQAAHTYSFRIASGSTVTVKHLSSGTTGSGPVTQMSIKRLR